MSDDGGDDDLLTVGEAAAVLRISEDTVRRRSAEGELGQVIWTKPPNGGQRRLSARAVEAYRRRMLGETAAEQGPTS